jgi:hypothetical protein
MSSKNSIILTRLLLQMTLASILQSCGSADAIAILEEPKAVLGDQNKNLPLLSRVKAERIALFLGGGCQQTRGDGISKAGGASSKTCRQVQLSYWQRYLTTLLLVCSSD